MLIAYIYLMKKWVCSAILGILSIGSVTACDVCGCSASGNYLGILPQYWKHFAGLSYKFQEFSSVHPTVAGENTPMQSKDRFQSLTAWGRFYPSNKVQLFAFVPYHFNTVEEAGQRTEMAGLGDLQILANYIFLNNTDTGNMGMKHTFLIGGGLKFPTGKNGFTNREGLILSNMQPGTGSWDFIINTNYTVRFDNWGMNADALVRIPTVNHRDYRYGTRFNNSYSIFYWKNARNLSWLPQAGIRYEWSERDVESWRYKIDNPYSGGYQLYVHGGAGLYFRKIAVQGVISLPVAENYASGLVTSQPRLEAQIQYLF